MPGGVRCPSTIPHEVTSDPPKKDTSKCWTILWQDSREKPSACMRGSAGGAGRPSGQSKAGRPDARVQFPGQGDWDLMVSYGGGAGCLGPFPASETGRGEHCKGGQLGLLGSPGMGGRGE